MDRMERYDWFYGRIFTYDVITLYMKVTKTTKVVAATPVKAVKKVKPKPIDENDYGPDLKHFTCLSCKGKFYDIELYFKGTKAKKCLSCSKFPKEKQK